MSLAYLSTKNTISGFLKLPQLQSISSTETKRFKISLSTKIIAVLLTLIIAPMGSILTIHSLDTAAQETANGVDVIKESVVTLSQVSTDLREIVEKFKL